MNRLQMLVLVRVQLFLGLCLRFGKTALQSATAKHSPAAQDASRRAPGNVRRGRGGGRFACAYLGSLRGLELIPSKWRSVVPPGD